ncbi:MAG: hypothetical protein ACOC8D_00660, partial [bacterium]
HRHTVELLPWLRPHTHAAPAAGEEFMVELASLAGPGALAMAEPALLLFLAERNAEGHRLTPLDGVAAVSRLANENVRAADPRGAGPAGEAFRALTSLVTRVRSRVLSVGPDLETLADAVLPLLAADG